MKRKTIIKQSRRVAVAACWLLVGASVMQSCKDEVLTGQPEWLGNSVYERLQEEGNYTTMLKLIDDLEQTEVLSHTGSKTLFAADDQAYQEWFSSNDWGVRSYDQLTMSQKKLLLNNAMINNAYLIELMSNVSGNPPMEGRAMRRETAASIYDSVYIMPVSEMPLTPGWAEVRSRGKAIPLFKDGTSAPMIHFLPAYMQYNNITGEDLRVLTNGRAADASEAWVNGKKVVERDITCKNGYIQKVDGVIESSPNMAEIIRQNPQMSMWSHLLDRFSAPYYHAVGTREYNRLYNNEDSVFTLRYYSKRSLGAEQNAYRPDGETVPAMLQFDPGWNQYYPNVSETDLHYDAGAMIVPTNEALEAWWNGEGKDLQQEYHEWDSIPDATLAKLLNVNMLDVFSSSVPSKFGAVLNDAKEPLGITTDDVAACYMGCNGVVYLTNKVFSPAEYASVAYPALAHASTMNVIYWVIDQLNFLPYLLSMQSKYALVLPTNDAMLSYLDPASYGSSTTVTSEDGTEQVTMEAPQLIKFRYDATKVAAQRVQASRYNTTVDADGNITEGDRLQLEVDANYNNKVLSTMLDDVMNQLIIVIPDGTKTLDDYIAEGYSLFKTKGGSLLRVTRGADGNLVFEGGWQMEHNHKALPITAEYPKTNGRSYQVENQVPMGAQRSLYMTLKAHPEYEAFLNLLENDYTDLLIERLGSSSSSYTPGNQRVGNKNLRLFDNYNYTVYIPSNKDIRDLQAAGYLPTDEELEFANEEDAYGRIDSISAAQHWYDPVVLTRNELETERAKVIKAIGNVVSDFIRYHVQDHSVAVGMAPEVGMTDNNFESMKRNLETGRFYPLVTEYSPQGVTVTDVMGNTRHVVQTEGLYNNICREYWFQGTGYNSRLFMASDAVVHLIDGPLFYGQPKLWKDAVTEALNQ